MHFYTKDRLASILQERPELLRDAHACLAGMSGRVLITGAAGFIGSHVSYVLKRAAEELATDGKPQVQIFGVDINHPDFDPHEVCHEFRQLDLRNAQAASQVCQGAHTIVHFAASMGGMGFITQANDAEILQHNLRITENVIAAASKTSKVLFASSACVYPHSLQSSSAVVELAEADTEAGPCPPDAYGFEKCAGERQVQAWAKARDHHERVGMIARFHNIYGPCGTFANGREKAPAALMRKSIAAAVQGQSSVKVWGDGTAMRTYCYIWDAVAGILALLRAEYPHPVNIGSSEVISVKDLGLLCANIAGVQDPHILHDDASTNDPGLRGVQTRSCDGSLALAELGWSPTTSLQDGLQQLHAWMLPEITRMLGSIDAEHQQALMGAFMGSAPVNASAEPVRFGLLLPITSRGSTRSDLIANVSALAQSFKATVITPAGLECAAAVGLPLDGFEFQVHIGVDSHDKLLMQPDMQDELVRELLAHAGLSRCHVSVHVFHYPPGSVVPIWTDLAQAAVCAGADYALLLGDDVVLLSPGWPNAVHQEFERIAQATGLPHGFACVAAHDESFPGFPTFPVISKVHVEAFGGRAFPATFVNQDADPFIFALYSRFNAARICSSFILSNGVGGAQPARYHKVHNVSWKDVELPCAVATLEQHLAAQTHRLPFSHIGLPASMAPAGILPRALSVDLIMPTYRTSTAAVQRAVKLVQDCPVPQVDLHIIVVIDHDREDAAIAEFAKQMHGLELKHANDARIRIRWMPHNSGASAARNRGLAESHAEFVMFLDDDVVCPPDALAEVLSTLKDGRDHITGLIPTVQLPVPQCSWQRGLDESGTTYFWSQAQKGFPALPWGITAALVVRRPPDSAGIRFDPSFPKTGGGEDIDYCLQVSRYWKSAGLSGVLRTLQDARVLPDYWSDSPLKIASHIFGWAVGDGMLADRYPGHSYHAGPNLVELAGILCVGVACFGGWSLVSTGFSVDSVTALMSTIGRAMQTLCAAAFVDMCLLFHTVLTTRRLLGQTWAQKAAAFLWCVVFCHASEAGRLWGHWQRGSLATNVCKRFDWFAGDLPEAVQREQHTSTLRLAGIALGAVLVAWCCCC